MGPLFVKGGSVPTWPSQTVLQVQLEAESVDGLPNPAAVRRAVETAANIWNETAKQLPAADSPRITIAPDPAPNIPDGEFSKYIVRENGIFRVLADGRSFDWNEDSLVTVLVHEFGHSFNLGHTENPHGILNPLQPDERVPAMYPIADSGTIREDDKASLALLYPGALVADTYVRVSGRVVTADRIPVQNSSVILEPAGAGGVGSYSAFTRSNGEGRPGEFDLLVLPGRYSLFVENPRFQQERRTQPRVPDNVPPTMLQVDKGKPIPSLVIQLP